MAPITRPTCEPSDPRSEATATAAEATATAAEATAPMSHSTEQPHSQPVAASIPHASAAAWTDPNAALPMYAQPQPFSGVSPYAYPSAYPSTYSQYPATSYASPYAAYQTGYMYPGMSRHTAASTGAAAPSAREAGAVVLNGMQEAMSRFARVSALLEDVLRHLHMLFDAVFGLGYSIGVFRQEAGLWFALKTGPVGFAVRSVRRIATVWRLLCVFFMSPLAGRFSPVALVLRILGLVPDDSEFELSLTDLFNRGSVSAEEASMADAPALGNSNIASAPDASHM